MTMPFSRRLTVSALCLGVVPLADAATSSDSDSTESEQLLNPLVVTATLAPQTADQSLASVTVLDEADLRRQDPTDITDILRAQPGVDVSSNGSFGKTSSVYLRGTSGKSTVMMIDGIRLRSATDGAPAWQYLEPRMFERVEIVRGPRGSLYGADAVGGVVQLFTPEGQDEPAPRITVGAGSHNTQRYAASLTGAEDGTRYAFSASRFSTDGYEVIEGEGDKGYDNTTGFARVSHAFDNGAELGVLALRSRGNTEFVGGDIDYVQQVAGVYGELPVTDAWKSRLTLSEARDTTETAVYDSLFDTRTRTLRWENTVWVGPHELVAGAEYLEDDIAGSDTGSGTYAEERRDNVAVFAQALMDFSPVSVQAGLRHDDNEAFGEELTGHLALGYELDDHHTLRASYGTAYRAPTFNELYYPDLGYFAGNPDLEAETSATVELGMRGQYTHFFWDLAAYETRVDDFIASTGSQNENIDEARIRGLELASGFEVSQWMLRTALTLTDTEDRETGHRLPRRASQSLRLDLDRELGNWSLGGSFIAQNHRYDDAANQERLGGFGQMDLRAGWQFAPLWSARLSIDNVFDKAYATTRYFDGRDYLNAGRTAFLSVNFGQ